MQWFRLYDDLLDDPKAQQLKPELFKHWINLLCLANKGTPRGTLPGMKDIAFRLRVSALKADEIIDQFLMMGLLDYENETLQPHNWDRRQRASDDVAERVRKHRSNVTEPLPVTPSKLSGATDTDTDTEQNQKENTPQPPKGERVRPIKPLDLTGFEEFYEIFPRHVGRDPAEKAWAKLSPEERTAAIAAIREQITWPTFTDVPPDKIPHPTTWLNQGRWKDEPDRPTNVQPIRPPTRPQLPPVMQPGSVPPDGGLAAWRSGNTGG